MMMCEKIEAENMSEKKLPFTLDVEMRAYHNKSFPLGIMKANIKDYRIWLCNKLINCIFRSSSGTFDLLEDDLWSVREGVTFSQNLYTEPLFFANEFVNLIDLNKSMIDKNHYITGAYNEFYIPNKKPYKSYDFNHDYIIIGYSEKKNCFNSVAYLKNGMYKEFELDFEDYLNAVINNNISKTNINYYKINREFIPSINLKLIKEKLEQYLSSNNGSNTNQIDKYGIDTWNELVKYLFDGRGKLDTRFGRAFMEHKAIMLNRIVQLTELKFIDGKQLIRDYENIYLESYRVHNMFIKFNMQYNQTLLRSIGAVIDDINKKEAEVIDKVIKVIH